MSTLHATVTTKFSCLAYVFFLLAHILRAWISGTEYGLASDKPFEKEQNIQCEFPCILFLLHSTCPCVPISERRAVYRPLCGLDLTGINIT